MKNKNFIYKLILYLVCFFKFNLYNILKLIIFIYSRKNIKPLKNLIDLKLILKKYI